ncbi:MAG: M28 family peptidase [Bacteroidota bacterium]
MMRIALLSIGILVLSCMSTQTVETTADIFPEDPTVSTLPEGLQARMPQKALADALTPFTSIAKVKSLLDYMASDELQGRDTGSLGIAKAADYIEATFRANGIAPYYPGFRDTLTNVNTTAYNMVGWVPGKHPQLQKEYLIIGAHYDHIGIQKSVQGDSIANGANDNASGSVAVLELARYFGTIKNNERSLIFVLFSGEEKGLLGSKNLAKRMKAEGLNLYAMLNFEMIGVPMERKYDLYLTGYDRSNMASVCNAYVGHNLVGYLPTAQKYALFHRSDNYPFYEAFKVPAHTFCSFDFMNFEYYHKVGDEVAQMDLSHMTQIINSMIPIVEGIANASTQELKMTK